MATQTLLLAVVRDETGDARLEIDYDDSSDPADWDLIGGRVVNNMARSCFVVYRRGQGQAWFEREVSAQSTQTQSAGGPVRNLSDLADFSLVTR